MSAMPSVVEPWVLLTLVALGLHLFAEYRQWPTAIALTKLTASSGFLMVAVTAGALELAWGRWLFAGLALSFVGDACLFGSGIPMFFSCFFFFLL